MNLPKTVGDSTTRGERIFQGVSYSRPRTYISYNSRVSKPYVLNEFDPQTQQVKELLWNNKLQVNQIDDLIRGIHFEDIVVGRRHYHHNSKDTEYYIHQWKSTNDLTRQHPTGSHGVYERFDNFFAALQKLVFERTKRI